MIRQQFELKHVNKNDTYLINIHYQLISHSDFGIHTSVLSQFLKEK